MSFLDVNYNPSNDASTLTQLGSITWERSAPRPEPLGNRNSTPIILLIGESMDSFYTQLRQASGRWNQPSNVLEHLLFSFISPLAEELPLLN